jgi:RNA recognition motif-containing protein
MGKKQKKEPSLHLELFVSGIPYTCTEEELKGFFGSDNITEIKMPKYQDTGRCLGYAHVVFSNQEDYDNALKKHRQSLGNRYL